MFVCMLLFHCRSKKSMRQKKALHFQLYVSKSNDSFFNSIGSICLCEFIISWSKSILENPSPSTRQLPILCIVSPFRFHSIKMHYVLFHSFCVARSFKTNRALQTFMTNYEIIMKRMTTTAKLLKVELLPLDGFQFQIELIRWLSITVVSCFTILIWGQMGGELHRTVQSERRPNDMYIYWFKFCG